MTPYDLPTYTFEKDFRMRDFLTDPVDHGSWVAMCLARTYIMTNAPIVNSGVFEEQDKQNFPEEGIRIGWILEPPHMMELRAKAAGLGGWGNPEPTHLVILDGRQPSDVFFQLRLDGVDEIGCYFLTRYVDIIDLFPKTPKLYQPGIKEIQITDKGAVNRTVPRFVGPVGMPNIPDEVLQMVGACAELPRPDNTEVIKRLVRVEETLSNVTDVLKSITSRFNT